MKPTLLLATLSLVCASPTALAKSELEKLRELCAEQDRQIRLLEEENARLMSLATREKTRAFPELITNPTPAAKPAAKETPGNTYTVVAGDNLAKISRKVGGTADSIAKLNGIKTTTIIHPGQKLKVPGRAESKPAVARTEPARPAPTSGAATHKVVSGETFYSISKKHGIDTEAIIAANPGVKSSSLRVGQVLQLATPSVAKSAPSEPAPTPAATEAPKPSPAPVPEPVAQTESPGNKPVIRSVTIEGEMTYGDFAATHGTNADRLNDLNGLDLTSATVLAKGSELYVPVRP